MWLRSIPLANVRGDDKRIRGAADGVAAVVDPKTMHLLMSMSLFSVKSPMSDGRQIVSFFHYSWTVDILFGSIRKSRTLFFVSRGNSYQCSLHLMMTLPRSRFKAEKARLHISVARYSVKNMIT